MTLILRKHMLRTCCLAALLGTLPAVTHAAGTGDYDTLQHIIYLRLYSSDY